MLYMYTVYTVSSLLSLLEILQPFSIMPLLTCYFLRFQLRQWKNHCRSSSTLSQCLEWSRTSSVRWNAPSCNEKQATKFKKNSLHRVLKTLLLILGSEYNLLKSKTLTQEFSTLYSYDRKSSSHLGKNIGLFCKWSLTSVDTSSLPTNFSTYSFHFWN